MLNLLTVLPAVFQRFWQVNRAGGGQGLTVSPTATVSPSASSRTRLGSPIACRSVTERCSHCFTSVVLRSATTRRASGTSPARRASLKSCVTVGGVRPWRWRAVDEHGGVHGVVLHRPRATEAPKPVLARLLGECHVPETVCTGKLASDGAAIRALPALQEVGHPQVIRAEPAGFQAPQATPAIPKAPRADDHP